MISRQSFAASFFSFVLAALGLGLAPLAVATHSGTTATSSGTSTCKLCTLIDWKVDVGDLDVAFENAPTNWNGAISYTSRPGQTITGTVCGFGDNNANCDTAEFVVSTPIRCTGYAASSCETSGRNDSLKIFTQQCGTQTTDGPADCVGRLEAVTVGVNGSITPGLGVNVGGAAALSSGQCASVFPNATTKEGFNANYATKQMGKIAQKHVNNRTCTADDVVDQSQDQRACSSPFGSNDAGSCLRGGTAQPAGIELNQAIVAAATGSCNPNTMQSGCSGVPNRDKGTYRMLITAAELANASVSFNDVINSSIKCGDGVTPQKVTRSDTNGDGQLDLLDVQCLTCVNAQFQCPGGQCEITGSDGVQPFAGLCSVILQ